VVDLNGKVLAQEVGQMEYRAPDQKKFAVTSEKGSVLVRRLALNALSPVRSKPRRVSSITIALSPRQTTLWTCSVSNWISSARCSNPKLRTMQRLVCSPKPKTLNLTRRSR
jgi:hypothetical protein